MDPNEALRELRDWAHANHGVDDNAEIFEGLDHWLCAGGFLPDDWKQMGNR